MRSYWIKYALTTVFKGVTGSDKLLSVTLSLCSVRRSTNLRLVWAVKSREFGGWPHRTSEQNNSGKQPRQYSARRVWGHARGWAKEVEPRQRHVLSSVTTSSGHPDGCWVMVTQGKARGDLALVGNRKGRTLLLFVKVLAPRTVG